MSSRCPMSPAVRLLASLIVTVAVPSPAAAQVAGESVNMVSGTTWPGGDPFLQRQNEPSIAVSSANPMHLLAGANDYRTVDVPFVAGATKMAADAWQGVFKSYDGGQTWKSYLMPGYPQDTSFEGRSSAVRGPNGEVLYNAGADPVVRAGTDGMFYFAGIVFERGENDGRVVLNRFIDLNNKENGEPVEGTDPIQWAGASVIDQGGAWFADKPWIAVDIPRPGAQTCTITRADESGRELFRRSFAGGAIYAVWARIFSDTAADVMLSRSLDCGATWSAPIKLNDNKSQASQGAVVSIDPRTGYVYVAWRRFGVATATPPQAEDAIFAVRSFSKGLKFTRPRLLTTIDPFEQGQAPYRFRTEALPTIASSVDATGTRSWTHVAWAQRSPTTRDSQIVMTQVVVKPPPPSNDESDDPCDGWRTPTFPIDPGPVIDGAGNSFSRGHQFMPQLTFSQGRLVAVYYDSRLDHTRNYYRPHLQDPCAPVGSCWVPDSEGRWYDEERGPIGERGQDLDWTTLELDDTSPPYPAAPTQVRHTIDVRIAMAAPAAQPVFTSTTLSRMPFGERGDEDRPDPSDPTRDQADPLKRPFSFTGHIDLLRFPPPGSTDRPELLRLQDLQVNPPNLPMFKNGTTAFIGDYIDVQGSMFVRTATGWAFDTQPTETPVFHAVWTSNQDVVPPPDGDWARYTPPAILAARPSLVDGSTVTVPACNPDDPGDPNARYTGTRNQNVYTARVTDGLFVSSPQNAKVLDTDFERNFVVSAFNGTSRSRVLTFSFTPPPNATASFQRGGSTTSAQVTVPPHSTAVQTIFMRLLTSGTNPATMVVNVTEDQVRVGSVTLNPPGATFDLAQPDGSTDSIAAGEVLTVRIGAAHLSNANLSNANLSNANLSNANLSNANLSNANLSNANLSNTTIDAAHLSNANLSNANLSNANLSSANLSNANLSNANLSNANLSNASLSDIDYVVTNTGNTTQAFDVRLLAVGTTGPVQLIVSRTYAKPIADGCALLQQPDNRLLVNAGVVEATDDLATQAPLATFAIAPRETIQVTLRTLGDVFQARTLATNIAPVVSPQGVPFAPTPALVVTTPATPTGAVVGLPYTLPLEVTGAVGSVAWTVAAGSLPAGLRLAGNQITGVPAAAGAFAFTLQVSDQGGADNLTQKDVLLVVGKGVTTTGLTTPTATAYHGDPVTLTATVAPGAGPNGTVTFLEGGTVLGTAPVTAAGTATLTVSSLSIGLHDVVARYAGDGNWNGSTSSSVAVRIKVRTALRLSTDPAFPVFGGSVVLVATIDPLPPGAPPPTVPAQFSDGGRPLGTGTFLGGVAVSPAFTPSGGTHLFGVAFAGDANYDGASIADQPVVVARAAVTVDLTSDGNPSVHGTPVTFTARVTSPAGIPAGSVTFYDGTTAIGAVPLDLLGFARLSPQVLAGGAHAVRAYYEGTTDFAPATSATLTQTVTSPATTTVLTASPNPVREDKRVTLTATVTGTGGTPTGTVTFLDGTKAIGTATLSLGKATLSRKPGSEGSHTLTAVYGGSAAFASSTSAPMVLRVLEEYSCSAYKIPLAAGGTISSPTRSGTFLHGTKVAVKWQFRKASGAYVTRTTAVKTLEAVYDALCNGKPAATATRITLFAPATGAAAGSTFTFDTSANQYNLSWSTAPASKGCWDIVLTPDNGIPQVATIVKLQ